MIAHVQKITAAEKSLNDQRELAADRGGNFQNFGHDFWNAWDDLLLAVRQAVAEAEDTADAPFMRKLVPVLDAVSRGITIRRQVESDRINSPVSHFTRFLANIDNSIIPAIRGLSVAARGPQIKSPLAMMKEMNGPNDPPERWINPIHATWNHVDRLELVGILNGVAEDLPVDSHPEIVQWKQTQASMPDDWDDSVLAGACREIERRRERNSLPV